MIRLCKISLVATTSLFYILVVYNNIVDYGSNYAFVENVLGMTTVFEGNAVADSRAITSPIIHHLFYWTIILWEAIAGVLLGWGAWKLWEARGADPEPFHFAKDIATYGFVIGMLQWYLAFITVGGEWFQMWQSQIWNGQDAAFRMFAILGISLLFLRQYDDGAPFGKPKAV